MRALLIGEVARVSSNVTRALRELDPRATVLMVSTAALGYQRVREDSAWQLVLVEHFSANSADAFEILAELRVLRPALPIVLVSDSDRKADVLRALDLGAVAFLPVDSALDTLVEGLRLAFRGGIYVPPRIMRGDNSPLAPIVGFDASWDGRLHDSPPVVAKERTPDSFGLTPRQTDVLFLLLQGQTNKQIARELQLSVETVKEHVAAVLRALNVNSRAKAVLAVNPLHSAIWDWPTRREGLGYKR